MMSGLMANLRFAFRSAVRQPVFTLVVILTLALGIGANTAMFATLRAALMLPQDFKDPDRLVFASCTFSGRPNPIASAPDFYDYREQADRFDTFAAMLGAAPKTTITGGREPERAANTFVSDDLFRMLGVAPAAGRWFTPEEGRPEGPPVVMISERLAIRTFGGARDAVGGTFNVNGRPVIVVGVMPATFRFFFDVDVWVPMRRGEAVAGAPRQFHNWLIFGRLKPGVTLRGAQQQVDVISKRLEQQYPDSNRNKALRLDPLGLAIVGSQLPRVAVLVGAVGLLLLIACANVAGLLLARASARRGELAVRASLGATRGRLVGQLLTESLPLATISSLVGMMLAFWLQRLLPLALGLADLGVAPTGLSWQVLLFALGISMLTGLVFGVAPALRASSLHLALDLGPGSRSTEARGGFRLRGMLVVGQVALSLVLLIAAGLLARSLGRLAGTNPGFVVEHLLTGEIQLLASQYPDEASRVRFFEGLRQDLGAIPGVTGVGFTSHLPIRHRSGNIPAWAADSPPATPADRRLAHSRIVLPGYFHAMRIPLQAGRDFAETDRDGAPRVLIVNEVMARTLFPDRNPLGQRVMVDLGGKEPAAFDVVGVVGNAQMDAIGQQAPMTMYAVFYQRVGTMLRIAIRTAVDPESLTTTVRRLVRARDRDIPVENLVSMERLVADSIVPQRVTTVTLAMFSGAALLLAAIGLYGVLAFYVSQRTHEIGVRMSLGADTRRVVTRVLAQSGMMVGPGLVLGLIGSLAASRLLAQVLFEVTPTDPATLVVVSGTLALVALLASAVPAWRAARIDPVRALRNE
jgi:putative ABC transport system permease protein